MPKEKFFAPYFNIGTVFVFCMRIQREPFWERFSLFNTVYILFWESLPKYIVGNTSLFIGLL